MTTKAEKKYYNFKFKLNKEMDINQQLTLQDNQKLVIMHLLIMPILN